MGIRIISEANSIQREKSINLLSTTSYSLIEAWDDYLDGVQYIYPYIWNPKAGSFKFDSTGVYEISLICKVFKQDAGQSRSFFKLVNNLGAGDVDVEEWIEHINTTKETRLDKSNFSGSTINLKVEHSLSANDIVDDSVKIYLNGQLIQDVANAQTTYTVVDGVITFTPALVDWDVTVLAETSNVSENFITFSTMNYRYQVDSLDAEVWFEIKHELKAFNVLYARITVVKV